MEANTSSCLSEGFPGGAISRSMTFSDPSDLLRDFPRLTDEALDANFKVSTKARSLAGR